MKITTKLISHSIKLSIASVLLLSGCSFSNDSLFGETDEEVAFSKSSSASIDGPALGSTTFEPVKVSKGSSTGTFVGQKVNTFRNEVNQLQNAIKNHNSELQRIRSSVISNAQQYHKTVANMEARLQIGTTPGNPEMFAMLQNAQNNVQTMSANTVSLNQLSNRISADATTTTYLLESIRSTYSVSGAVDEDHRQLRILENETNQTYIIINSLLTEVNNDASRQIQYVETANRNLIGLDSAIRQGNFNGVNTFALNSAPLFASVPSRPVTSASLMALGGVNPMVAPQGKPLFVAKFNQENVRYKDGLTSAVNNAVQKKPGVVFDVVAVSPQGANQTSQKTARTRANDIFSEMVAMGVSADRILLSARTSADAGSPEVQIFVR